MIIFWLLFAGLIAMFVYEHIQSWKRELAEEPSNPTPKEDDWGVNRLYWKVGDIVRVPSRCREMGTYKLVSWGSAGVIANSVYTAYDIANSRVVEHLTEIAFAEEDEIESLSARERQETKKRQELADRIKAESVYEMSKAEEFQRQQGL
jgi:hypothetical protein